MSQVDWQTVYRRYFQLIERVSTRSEFSDLMWEMQGELGTSHAYEFGGDYRPRPYYGQGFLGAELTWDGEAGGYRIGELLQGDPWDRKSNSPLSGPGIDVEPGDVLLAINGQRLDAQTGPAQLLVNQAGNEVLLTLQARARRRNRPPPRRTAVTRPKSQRRRRHTGRTMHKLMHRKMHRVAHNPMHRPDAQNRLRNDERRFRISVVVKAVHSEAPACYRSWVKDNRRKVHEATGGHGGLCTYSRHGAEAAMRSSIAAIWPRSTAMR